MPIRQLAADLAAKIAAGEVVERPASVVKELIENSIDSGATQIRVELAQGGLQLIRVIDNGCGIPIEELPLALARHATSKVTSIDDLEQIHTLGFRGEALASIAAVAEMSLVSRVHNAEQGAEIQANGGQLSNPIVAATSEGTTISVRNLFSAVPARLKFLKSRSTEVNHCLHMLQQYALAYPEVRFTVINDGRPSLNSPGDGQLRSVIAALYGVDILDQMIPIGSTDAPADAETPGISGYVTLPTHYKSSRQHVSFFVNRRWVLSRSLMAAVDGAYHSLLLSGRYPVAIINITTDPTQLDVNVHPAKTEIRFLKERRIFAAVLHSIREKLVEAPEIPRFQGQAERIEHSKEPVLETQSDELPPPTTPFAPQPFESETPGSSRERLWQKHVRPQPQHNSKASIETSLSSIEKILAPLPETQPLDGWQFPHVTNSQPTSPFTIPEKSSPTTTEQKIPQTPIDLDAANMKSTKSERRLPPLRVIGQLSQSYIISEGPDGLYLIDQHAAHERILLEQMVATMKARRPLSQFLLTPMQLELSPQEVSSLEEHFDQLKQIGFQMEIDEEQHIQVTAVPDVFVKQMNTHSLHELLVQISAAEELGTTETWEERALANVACKAAIKANHFLTPLEMRELLELLEQAKSPFSCCHGRPTTLHFSLSTLEREFGRR